MRNSSRKWGGGDGKEVLNNYSSVHSLKSFLGLATSLDQRTQFLSRQASVPDSIQVPFTASASHPYGHRCSNIPLGLLVWGYSTIPYGSSTPLVKCLFLWPQFFLIWKPQVFPVVTLLVTVSLLVNSRICSNPAILVMGLCPGEAAGGMVCRIYNIGSPRQFCHGAALSKHNAQRRVILLCLSRNSVF